MEIGDETEWYGMVVDLRLYRKVTPDGGWSLSIVGEMTFDGAFLLRSFFLLIF